MKHPAIDYRNFRLSKVNDPQYTHLKLLWGWIIYFILYALTENLIPEERCYPVHCRMDDLVPFSEWFVIPYVSWYFLVAGSLIYFLIYHIDSFRKLQTYIIITQALAMAIYILFPNRQDLRPEVFPRENILTQILGLIYAVDTNTGVCPSLHVGFSLGIISVWVREEDVSWIWKAIIVMWSVLICLSVAFVKQHSVVDILAAFPMCLFADWFVYSSKRGHNMET